MQTITRRGIKNAYLPEVLPVSPDDMASTFVLTGTPDEVKKRLEPAWEIADSVTLVPPALSLPEKTFIYTQTIEKHFTATLELQRSSVFSNE